METTRRDQRASAAGNARNDEETPPLGAPPPPLPLTMGSGAMAATGPRPTRRYHSPGSRHRGPVSPSSQSPDLSGARTGHHWSPCGDPASLREALVYISFDCRTGPGGSRRRLQQNGPGLAVLPRGLAGLRPHRHRATREDLRPERPTSSTRCITARSSVPISNMADARHWARSANEGSTGAEACSAASACAVWRATAARNVVTPSDKAHGARRSRDAAASDSCHLSFVCNIQFMSSYRHAWGHHIIILPEPALPQPPFGTPPFGA